jgi:hypothetical protein
LAASANAPQETTSSETVAREELLLDADAASDVDAMDSMPFFDDADASTGEFLLQCSFTDDDDEDTTTSSSHGEI